MEGYEYRLLEVQNEFSKYKISTQKILDDKEAEILKLYKINKDLKDKISFLEAELVKPKTNI